MRCKRLCVFAGASSGSDPGFAAAAEALGRELAARRIGLVYGGATRGLMGRAADAALAAGGTAIGVVPAFLTDRETPHPGLTELHVVDTLHERVQLMAELSDGYVALPGGIGTLAELFEVMSFTLLGVDPKPCGALDVAGYYQPLARLLDSAVESGFLAARIGDLVVLGDSPAELLEALAGWAPLPG